MVMGFGQGSPGSLQIPPAPYIPGALLWLRADFGVSYAGSNAYGWWDLSNNGHNAVQLTTAKQPTSDTRNGKPSLRFTKASSQFMSVAVWNQAIPVDIFVVGQLASSTAGQQAFFDRGNQGGGQQNIGYFSGSSTGLNLFAGANLAVTVADATLALSVYRFTSQNVGSNIYVNGSLVATGTTGDPGSVDGGIGFVGANISGASNLDGWISEILEFPLLSTSDARTVTSALGGRYGIAVH